MTQTTTNTTVMEKTRELCQMLLDEPNVQSIRTRIDTFMGDEQARNQYDAVVQKGQTLQNKQQNAEPLSGDEIADFEKHRDALLNNPVARGFLDAQEELHQVQQTIHRFVKKTLELGRLPTEKDLEGSCSHGCNCSH